MALNGTLTTNAVEEGRYYTLSWTATQSVANNQSTISWTLSCAGGLSWYAERTLNVVIAGSTVVNKTARVERYAGTIASGTVTVNHDSRGNASFSASIQAAVYTSSINCTASGSFALNNIPRQSSLSVSNGTLGVAQTITVTRQSTSFTHTITYWSGSANGTICTKSTSTSISFTPPVSLAAQCTNATSMTVGLQITTYNGDTSVGSTNYYITCAIPSSVKPTCTVTVSDAMGYLATYGGYVKNQSKLKVVVTPTIAYGSEINSYNTTANNTVYTTSSFTTDVIKSAGDQTISSTVKDKRGRTGSNSTTITVLDYALPSISWIKVKRCDSDGTENDQGDYTKVTFSSSITSLNSKNSATYSLEYKKTSDTDYTNVALSDYTDIYAVDSGSYIFAADSGSSYNVAIIATDDFGSTIKNTSVSTAATIMHFNASGNAMAVGKVSEKENAFEIGWDTYDKFGTTMGNGLAAYTGTGDAAINPDTTLESCILTNKNTPTTAFHYVVTYFYNTKSETANRTQVAYPYKTNADICIRYYTDGAWSDWFSPFDKNVLFGRYIDLNNNFAVRFLKSDGTTKVDVLGMNSSNIATLGYGGYAASTGATHVYGNTLRFYTKNNISINDYTIDYVLTYGTATSSDGISWYWRKWNSGIAECWGKKNYGTLACTTAYGSLYECPTALSAALPSTFFNANPTHVDISPLYSSGGVFFIQQGKTATTKRAITNIFVMKPVSISSMANTTIGFHVIGTWR